MAQSHFRHNFDTKAPQFGLKKVDFPMGRPGAVAGAWGTHVLFVEVFGYDRALLSN